MVGNAHAAQQLLYMSRKKEGRGMRSIEEEYKVTKIKAVVKLMATQGFEERAKELGHNSLVKEATTLAEEMGLQLQLKKPNTTCIWHGSGEVIRTGKLKGGTEEVSGAEITEGGVRSELAWETYLCKRGGQEPQYQRLFLVAKQVETMPNTCSSGHV